MAGQAENEGQRHQHGDTGLAKFTVRVLVTATIVSLFLLAWQIRHTFMLAFAAIVVAAVLLAASSLTHRYTSLGQHWSLAVSGLLILAAIGLILWIGWPNIQSQSSSFLQQLPQAVQNFERRTGINLPGSLEQVRGSMGGAFDRILRDVASIMQTAAAAAAGFILVLVTGAFLAANPGLYRDGLLLLVPPAYHSGAATALNRTGSALRRWLIGQLLSMTIVGVVIGIGAWAIGLPSPLALALIAFLTEFIPLIGPFLGAIPGLFLAIGQGWSTLLWTALLYLAVQQIESNLVAPLVQKEMVNVPPALFILSVVAMGALFGVMGVLLAGPLTVTAFVLVRTLYVERTLNEEIGREDPEERD